MTQKTFRIAIALAAAGFRLLANAQPGAARIFVDPQCYLPSTMRTAQI
jgi:hypothetical protein